MKVIVMEAIASFFTWLVEKWQVMLPLVISAWALYVSYEAKEYAKRREEREAETHTRKQQKQRIGVLRLLKVASTLGNQNPVEFTADADQGNKAVFKKMVEHIDAIAIEDFMFQWQTTLEDLREHCIQMIEGRFKERSQIMRQYQGMFLRLYALRKVVSDVEQEMLSYGELLPDYHAVYRLYDQHSTNEFLKHTDESAKEIRLLIQELHDLGYGRQRRPGRKGLLGFWQRVTENTSR